MKTFNLILLFTLFSKFSFAQLGINSTGASPNGSAMLDVSSTTKGLLTPRMTTLQRTGIAAPAKGLLVFDNDTNGFWYYNGSTWANLASSEGFTLPYQQTVNTGSIAFDVTNQGAGSAIRGISNTVNTFGVYGESGDGNGIKGYGNNTGSVGVFGISLAGTGVYATSFTGKALDVNGNVKIAGGNTAPGAGKILTSDASGNATWKTNKVGFASSLPAWQNISDWIWTTVQVNEEYDASNNFNSFNAATDPNTFTSPVSGFYHFDAATRLYLNSAINNITQGQLQFSVNGSTNGFVYNSFDNFIGTGFCEFNIIASQSFHLNAGDKVKLIIQQASEGNATCELRSANFSGSLTFAD